MRPVFVVVSHEHIKNTLKVMLAPNQQPVDTFRPGCAHEPLRDAVGLRGAKNGVRTISILSLSKHLVKSVGPPDSRNLPLALVPRAVYLRHGL